jgi:hypothetical protein
MPFSARADRWRRLRTRAPEVLPERPVAAILAEIRANNRENRSVTGRELLGRRPRPPGYTARPKKPGARASTITSLALHTVAGYALPHGTQVRRHVQRGSSRRSSF